MDFVAHAQRLVDEVLFPAALATDAADTLPVELLDELAGAGLYGLDGADFSTVCRVVETLASGCLTTAFVWVQHLGAVRAAATSDSPVMREWLPLLSSGERRSGLALGGALAGEPLLVARQAGGGWRLDGTSPFVSGWVGSTSCTLRHEPETAASSGASSTRTSWSCSVSGSSR